MIGGMVAVYCFRYLFLYLFRKFLHLDENRKYKNLALILSVLILTFLFYLPTHEIMFHFLEGGIILLLLGFIPEYRRKKENAS